MPIANKHTLPNHVISLNEPIQCFELASHECCQNLTGIAVDGKIILGIVRFPEECESETFEWQPLKEIVHETRCHAISFAPDTSLAVLPKSVKFCAAGSDFQLRIFRSSLSAQPDNVLHIKGHTGYVNDVAWDPQQRFLASVSDDHTCIVWSERDDCDTRQVFRLRSAGMSVRWHPDDADRILVAEKRGYLYIFNVLTQQTVLSVEMSRSPLRAADWSAHNRSHICALVNGELNVWNVSGRRGVYRQWAQEIRAIHEDGGQAVCFAAGSDSLVASVGRPGNTLKVTHTCSAVPLLEAQLSIFGGLGWHYRLPYVVAASDRKLCFWRVIGK